jgi:azurin
VAAGLPQNYVKAGDARVVAHTKIVGGGESDSVSFAPAKLATDGSYTFFCSFPGHSALMKGTLKLVK